MRFEYFSSKLKFLHLTIFFNSLGALLKEEVYRRTLAKSYIAVLTSIFKLCPVQNTLEFKPQFGPNNGTIQTTFQPRPQINLDLSTVQTPVQTKTIFILKSPFLLPLSWGTLRNLHCGFNLIQNIHKIQKVKRSN